MSTINLLYLKLLSNSSDTISENADLMDIKFSDCTSILSNSTVTNRTVSIVTALLESILIKCL